MPEVSGRTLMMAVQAVQKVMREYEAEQARTTGDDQVEWDEILATYDKAAAELERAYREAQSTSANLPPYERLVRQFV